MSESIGFQILTDEPQDGKPVRISLQVHQDRGDGHYYGGTYLEVYDRGEGGTARHQLVMQLLAITGQMSAMGDDAFDQMMKPVERPF